MIKGIRNCTKRDKTRISGQVLDRFSSKLERRWRSQGSWWLEEARFMAAGRGTRLWRRRHEFFL
ncbi:hypothetical protein F2Q69_00017204 [Brassica cretica]|uniref:Uncharacterized protein n=1 Tax=Brassica cretica TaxID=69181 RepID=A0A8S9QQ52_BRACR|nr:hypothetical protein F2Q69_00017204 [Brassica cretica]